MMKTNISVLPHADPVVIPSEGGMYLDPNTPEIEAAREALMSRLADSEEGTVVPVDLAECELSASCLAALLSVPLVQIVRREHPSRYLVVRDPDGLNEWDADAGLQKESDRIGEKLVCVWVGADGELGLVGEVDKQIDATYRFLAEREIPETTARDVADHFRLSIQAAGNRLARAHGLGILHRSDRRAVSGSGGSEHVYMAVK